MSDFFGYAAAVVLCGLAVSQYGNLETALKASAPVRVLLIRFLLWLIAATIFVAYVAALYAEKRG